MLLTFVLCLISLLGRKVIRILFKLPEKTFLLAFYFKYITFVVKNYFLNIFPLGGGRAAIRDSRN